MLDSNNLLFTNANQSLKVYIKCVRGTHILFVLLRDVLFFFFFFDNVPPACMSVYMITGVIT